MGEMTLWDERSLAERRLLKQLGVEETALWLSGEVAKEAIDRVGRTCNYAGIRVVMTLKGDQAVRDLVTPAGKRGAVEEAACSHRTKHYLDTVNCIVDIACQTTVRLADDLPDGT